MGKINVKKIEGIKSLEQKMNRNTEFASELYNHVNNKHKIAIQQLNDIRKKLTSKENYLKKKIKESDSSDRSKNNYQVQLSEILKKKKKLMGLIKKEKRIFETFTAEQRKVSQNMAVTSKSSAKYLNKAHDILVRYNKYQEVSGKVRSYDRTINIARYGSKGIHFIAKSVEGQSIAYGLVETFGPGFSRYSMDNILLDPSIYKEIIKCYGGKYAKVPLVGNVASYLYKAEQDEYNKRKFVSEFDVNEYEEFFCR